jgi:hypothetical protein
MEKIKNILALEEEEDDIDIVAVVADKSECENYNVDSAHDSEAPSTPKGQPTKPASTNAPERPPRICRGCLEEQPNQLAHVGGCLSAEEYADNTANDYEYDRVQVEKYEDCDYTEKQVKYEEEYKCPCYVEGCSGDCGTLWCGCIDVCRGRCGFRDRDSFWR